jgi:DNA (cytosine-5)-methyltransferase 1
VTLTALDLFSGIGATALAAREAGFEIVGMCEIQPFCRAVLRRHFPGVPVLEDIHDLSRSTYPGPDLSERPLTLLTGSAPFQANYARGSIRRQDPRWLWDEFARVLRELRPTWVVAETFPRVSHLGLDDALWDLERAGYAAATFVLPAQAFDCPQRIERLFIVGALAAGPRIPYREPPDRGDERIESWPPPEPGVCRVAPRTPLGLDFHVAALHAVGDSTVPCMARPIFEGIAAAEREFLNWGHSHPLRTV